MTPTPDLPPRPDRPKSVETEQVARVDVELPLKVEVLTVDDIRELLETHERLVEYAKRFNDGLLTEICMTSVEWKSQAQQLIAQFERLVEDKIRLRSEIDKYKKLEFEYLTKWQDLDRIITDKFSNDALKKQLRHDVINLDEKSARLVNEVEVNDDSLDMFLEQYVAQRMEYHLHREKLATWEDQGSLKHP